MHAKFLKLKNLGVLCALFLFLECAARDRSQVGGIDVWLVRRAGLNPLPLWPANQEFTSGSTLSYNWSRKNPLAGPKVKIKK
jgi:hypothetical protein